jgi:hypothetical protein
MRRFKKKSTAIIVGVPVVLVGAGAAFAYWTDGGAGTGSAATREHRTRGRADQRHRWPGAQCPGRDADRNFDCATVPFNNTGANQDRCKNATVTLAYSIA